MTPTITPDVTIEHKIITPEEARNLLEYNTHNRNPRTKSVAAYMRDMEAGKWKFNGDAIRRAQDGTILDGAHRLMACSQSGIPMEAILVSGLASESQDTMDSGVRRNFADALKLAGETDSNNLAALTVRITSYEKYGARAAFLRQGGFTLAELMETFRAHPELAETNKAVGRIYTSIRISKATFGLLFMMFSHIDRMDCKAFFTSLRTGEGLKPGDPILALRNILVKSIGARDKTPDVVTAALVIKAWNKYRVGDSVSSLSYRSGGASPEPFPEAI